jgi:branched-chain amino acid aminotransferase
VIHRFVLHNDEIVECDQRTLMAGQLGLLAGWGVFSTIRVYEGVLFEYDRHFARMRHDAELLHVPFPRDAAALKRSLLRLVNANEAFDASLRVVVVRNHGGLWEGPGVATDFDIIGLTANVTPWADSVRLGVVANARHAGSPFAGTKLLSWAYNLTWYEQAHRDGYDEVVLLNERGEVAECTSANIFAVFGNQVWTPPLASGCLPGVTRDVLLKEVKLPEFKVAERVLRLEDLAAADQVFITSTTRELLPVVSIEGIKVRNDSRACQILEDAFSAYIDNYVAAHKKASEPAYTK